MGLGGLVTIASKGCITHYINLLVDASFDRSEISIDIYRRSIKKYLTKSAEIIFKFSLICYFILTIYRYR